MDFKIVNFYNRRLDMQCLPSIYPFDIFPAKGLKRLDFEPLTIIYGGNGSGKSTLLNVIAEKLSLSRFAPFNKTPFFEDFLKKCSYESAGVYKNMPKGSEILTSDGVFDYLLNVRAVNEGVDRRREELFDEYDKYRSESEKGWQMSSLDEYDELVRRNEVRKNTKSKFTEKHLSKNIVERSNGESALHYFTNRIDRDALYLLDEPENSLSAKRQSELADFLSDSVRFYGCQLIISTHSPFLLSAKGAMIYDLDAYPACVRKWSELENVRAYYELFAAHAKEFE